MNVGDGIRHPSLYMDGVLDSLKQLYVAWGQLKAIIETICDNFNNNVRIAEELGELPIYKILTVKEYGRNLRIHKNDIYKVKSRPQKIQRVYRRWHNDYTYRFA